MKFTTTQLNGISVITLEGNLLGGPDASTLNGKLHELVDGGKKHVVIDLKKVGFINSSGLGLLIGGITTMRNAGGSLLFANASEKITGLITIAKLSTLFSFHPSVEEAVASIKQL